MRIKNQLVSSNVARTRTSPGTNPRRYITVHETANTSRGAGAQAHANLQSRGNARVASWHIQVDDTEAIRSYPDTVRCWHAGDGGGHGNMSSIGIEICVNSDGDFTKAKANAAAVIRDLRAKYDIPRSRVVQHNYWSGKNCPTNLRRSGQWAAFVASTDPDHGVKPAPTRPPASKPTPVPTPERTWFDMATKNDLRDVVKEQLAPIAEDVTKIKVAVGRIDPGKDRTLRDELNKIKTALERVDPGEGRDLLAEIGARLADEETS